MISDDGPGPCFYFERSGQSFFRKVRLLTLRLIALEGYELRIQKHGRLLEKHIADIAGKPIDVSTWFYFLSSDVMGDSLLQSLSRCWRIKSGIIPSSCYAERSISSDL